MTIGALGAAVLSYRSSFGDSGFLTSVRPVQLTSSVCQPLSESIPVNTQLSTDLQPTATTVYTVAGEHAFSLIAPKGGKCQSQTAPLAALKPIVSAGNATVSAAIWQGTAVQPYLQVITASGVGAAALTCAASARAADALVGFGEPKELITKECAPFTDQLKITHHDGDTTYFASKDIVTQGNVVVAVRYKDSGATPQALLASCSWSASSGNALDCYDYLSSIMASNL